MENSALVASLINDHDRAHLETPTIPRPNAIIVSGDIIQGARLGEVQWEKIIREQYDVAEVFLGELADRFLDGDRSRVVLVPGNHDVCWNTSFEAMEEVFIDPLSQRIRTQLDEPESPYRWSWSNLKYYRVKNEELYDRRLDAYWKFVQRFYDHADLIYKIDRNCGYQFFELDEGRVLVGAFDSTHRNDCFSHSGALTPGAAGRCYLTSRDLPRPPRLKIGVWHHSVQGQPTHVDYMSVNEVHELAGHGFQLGLHGHQHVAAESAYYVHRAQAQKMAVVSAGSLCAGSRELPRGVNRQYNYIVIEEDYLSARIHVREMVEGGHFARKTDGAFLDGYITVNWQPPLDLAGRPVDQDAQAERRAVEIAEEALARGDPRKALGALKAPMLAPGTHARRLALRAALGAMDWNALVQIFAEPTSAEETVHLVTAYEHLGRLNDAKVLLDQTTDLDLATREALADRIDIKRRMKGS